MALIEHDIEVRECGEPTCEHYRHPRMAAPCASDDHPVAVSGYVRAERLEGAVEALDEIAKLADEGDHGSLMDLGSRMVQIRSLSRRHRLGGQS